MHLHHRTGARASKRWRFSTPNERNFARQNREKRMDWLGKMAEISRKKPTVL